MHQDVSNKPAKDYKTEHWKPLHQKLTARQEEIKKSYQETLENIRGRKLCLDPTEMVNITTLRGEHSH